MMQLTFSVATCFALMLADAASSAGACKDILSPTLISEIRSFQPQVDKITAHVSQKEKGLTWKQTSDFVDFFGPRQAGFSYLEAAIDERREFLSHILGDDQAVTVEPVELPQWARGETELILLNAWSGNRNKTLSVTTLGGSVGTGPQGILADAIVVKSFGELDSKTDAEISGKIVVFDYDWSNYFDKVVYRRRGSSRAAAKGAIAVLIRSLTDYSLYTPHTGILDYTEDEPKIPSLAITVEDAELLLRKQNRGERLRLYIRSTAQSRGMVISRNLIADIKGRGKPDELVVIGAHIDSWDVGQGAMDDAGGLAVCWRTLEIMKKLNLTVERTVRSVFFTGEESGYYGANVYYANHRRDRDSTQFMLESDLGIYEVLGLATSIKNDQARCILSETMKLFAGINASLLDTGNFMGPDISNWSKDGVPAGSLLSKNNEYFHMHHSEADMMNVLNPEHLDKATILWTGLTYVFANLEQRIPHDTK